MRKRYRHIAPSNKAPTKHTQAGERYMAIIHSSRKEARKAARWELIKDIITGLIGFFGLAAIFYILLCIMLITADATRNM